MEYLRCAKALSRLVLVWFALSLGVALASPLVTPKAIEIVCTSGGTMKIVSSDDADKSDSSIHTLDCILCIVVGIPTTTITNQFTKPSSLAHALQPIAAAHIAAATAPPLPSRGPPLL